MSTELRNSSNELNDDSRHDDATAKPAVSFAETALRMGGKSNEEARRTGAVDSADDNVEAMFAERYRTTSSPVHRAIWQHRVPTGLFESHDVPVEEDIRRVMRDSLSVVRRHRDNRTLLNDHSKVSESVLSDLADAGYWGALIDRRYGGCGFPFANFATFLTDMATIDPTVAGLASVHGCIGAVDPIRTFGTAAQRERYLPLLASGRRLSAFALTEPCAGSDLTALRTTATRDGDSFLVNGEKLFITNATFGRTIGLVCRIDGTPAVLIVDLPEAESAAFQIRRYGLHALRHAHNCGLIFRDFRVPAENLLEPPVGDGLTIAYHGLNLGRVALCANAAGTMRMMLAEMLPWAGFRRTYGQSIAKRELVQRRIGQLAGLITGSDALVRWCSGLIDEGYRGEMECIIAKVFGSEALKYAAIELYMKTHGGRSFLHGHLFGDNVHEFLAPSIYEGEGEMLSMAFFKSLVKEHGKTFFEPIGKVLYDAGIQKPQLTNPRHLWMLRKPMMAYGMWYAGRRIAGCTHESVAHLPGSLRQHAEFACRFLSHSALEVSGTMRRHQLRLADRQCAMSQLSSRIQDAVTMLCTSLYAGRQSDSITQAAADVLCRDLRRRMVGGLATDKDFRAVTDLGQMICETEWPAVFGVSADPILMPYEQ